MLSACADRALEGGKDSWMTDSTTEAPQHFPLGFRWSGYLLGIAIGGFFDGILLHQILQWHHLLSGLEGGRFGDIRFQIMADGLFHALMYVIGGVGLWLLWRNRDVCVWSRSDRFLAANALIGFGAWHVFDSIASHWLLGIHRIRMDSEIPLFWDLLWFFVFGIAFILAGFRLRPGSTGGKSRRAVPTTLAGLIIAGGVVAAIPLSDAEELALVVVFLPGTTPAAAHDAISSIDGRLLWTDSSDQIWAIDVPPGTSGASLYGRGAMLVSGTLLSQGCLNWIEQR